MHALRRLRFRVLPHHLSVFESIAIVLLAQAVFLVQVSAVIRFQERSLLILDPTPGATTQYQLSMRYSTPTNVGSLKMLFCIDPIPQHPCVPPTGLNTQNAVLAQQTGETGFTVSSTTANQIIISRPTAAPVSTDMTKYIFNNIINPTYKEHSFAIRLSNYTSTNGTGTPIDIGSVVNIVNEGVRFETQVPPMLIYCMSQQVSLNCTEVDDVKYKDLGELSPQQTLTAQSQMAVGTNASGGYSITVHGTTMAAGTKVITPSASPTPSVRGTNQFGINFVANDEPAIGSDPDGDFTNATPASNYSTPNLYMYRDGDVVAGAPNVSLMRRFTASYIVNASPSLPAGVYTTTLTYIATPRF